MTRRERGGGGGGVRVGVTRCESVCERVLGIILQGVAKGKAYT